MGTRGACRAHGLRSTTHRSSSCTTSRREGQVQGVQEQADQLFNTNNGGLLLVPMELKLKQSF